MAKLYPGKAVASLLPPLLSVSACTKHQEKHREPRAGEFVALSVGKLQGREARNADSTLHSIWPDHARAINLGNHGLRPLLHFVHWKSNQFDVVTGDIPDNLRFENLGRFGYLLIELKALQKDRDEKEPLPFSGLKGTLAREGLQKPPEMISSTEATTPVDAPKGLSPEAHTLFGGAFTKPDRECVALGFHTTPEIYRLPQSKHASCILYRTPVDERIATSEDRSKLICIHKRKTLFLDTHLDRVQVLLPTDQSDTLMAYEGSYSPPHVTRINLSSMTTTTIEQPPQEQLDPFVTRRTAGLPEAPVGVYRCHNGSLLYLDADTFLARRAFAPEREMMWTLEQDIQRGVSTSTLNWNTTRERFPEILAPLHPSCSFLPAPDFRCALSVMPIAMQIFELLRTEAFAAQFPNPALQRDILLLAFLSLERLQINLPHWLLQREAESLMTVFAHGVSYLESHGVTTLADASAQVAAFLEAPPNRFFDIDEQERQAFRRLIPQVSDQQWLALDATAKQTQESRPEPRVSAPPN